MDGSLHGDVAVRRNIQTLLGTTEKISADEAQVWLQEFSPWRALVAAHLWAQQSVAGY
jgi:DNA-3-methyladenine glycosylase II